MQIVQILKTEVLPHYYKTEDGLRVPPGKVDYLLSPKLRQMDEKNPSFWKAMLSPLNQAYVEIQGPINDKNRPKLTKELRGTINSAFDQFINVRGGGSASLELSVQAPAQTEWMIRELGSDFESPLLFKNSVSIREEIRDKVVNEKNIVRLLQALPYETTATIIEKLRQFLTASRTLSSASVQITPISWHACSSPTWTTDLSISRRALSVPPAKLVRSARRQGHSSPGGWP